MEDNRNKVEKKQCYICGTIFESNSKDITVTYESEKATVSYYLCGRKCFCKLADHLKEHEPEGIMLINF